MSPTEPQPTGGSAPEPSEFDVVVVGGGAAGLHVALEVAAAGGTAALVSRKPLAESSSYWAQGGLAAAIASDDSPERHAEDTLNAGRGLCDPRAVEVLVNEAPAQVTKLLAYGVEFDLDEHGEPALALEGGHSARRIVHAGGASTGKAITRCLAKRAAEQPRIALLEGSSAIALYAGEAGCHGVWTDSGPVLGGATVLATGGGAALWARTTNPWGAIAAGSALAHEAGAELGGLELCQFHPTALSAPGGPLDGRLITEAVRGEGAVLVDSAGRRFTDELAPRDQVTAAILDRMAADGSGHVGLDLREVPLESFPSIVRMLGEAGFDPGEPVPVSPAAHYLIGGVRTDLDGGTAVPGLFAVGECAYTGLHGANRLASNSLSECFVFGSRAARAAQAGPVAAPSARQAGPEHAFVPPQPRTRERLWRLAGPLRTASELEQLLDDPYGPARMIAASALTRTESRGVHRRLDMPARDTALDGRHVIVRADGSIALEDWRKGAEQERPAPTA